LSSLPTFIPASRFSLINQQKNGIREGYWTLHEAATEGIKITEEDMPMMASPPHIRHCIDLIRQSLMCQPDTTIELKDEEVGGVTGFGTEHQCKDWEQLIQWTKKWQTYDPDERPTEEKHLHETHDHHVH